MLIVLGSLVNIIEGTHDHFTSTRIFTLIMSKIFIEVEIFEANGYRHDLELLIILHYLHVSYLTRSGCLFFCEPEN